MLVTSREVPYTIPTVVNIEIEDGKKLMQSLLGKYNNSDGDYLAKIKWQFNEISEKMSGRKDLQRHSSYSSLLVED